MNQLLTKKLQALEDFKDQVLSKQEIKNSLAKMILFGSVNEKNQNNVRPDSDVDILLFSFDPNQKKIRDYIYQSAFDSTVKYGESVEPIIYPYFNYAFPSGSVFLQKVLSEGKEIYTMDKKQIQKQEAQNYLDLAEEYLEEAQEISKRKRLSSFRLSIDAGYNAAELAVKGLLILKTGNVPKTHGGIVSEFGKFFVLTKQIPRQVGRELNASLDYRNRARYDKSAIITSEMKQEILKLARELIKILSAALASA